MVPGTQIRAPLGFASLKKMTRYHVIYKDVQVHNRLVLVSFTTKPRKAELTYLSIADFERARSRTLIKILVGDEGVRLPEWLSDRAAEVFDDASDGDGPLSDDNVMNARHAKVLVAVHGYEKIFSLIDPLPALRKLARECGTNEGRYIRDVLTFLAFDQKKDVLRPPKGGRGKYDRARITEAGRRSGRPNRKGPGHGFDVMPPMKEKIKKGWGKFARRNRTLKKVWVKTLVQVFGCKYRQEADRTYIEHPLGEPYPSYGEFRYWVLQFYGHKGVWATLLGEIEYRKRFPEPKGSYHEGLRDLLEKVYSDATTFSQLPKSHIGASPGLPLIEVPEYDALCGMVVGVAWGVGSETSSLYLQARAVTALPKSLVGEVLGMLIRDEDYPVSGILPRTGQTDNGAGAAKKIAEINRRMGTSPDVTPAYNPQTNAPIEQTHEPTLRTSGMPQHEVSKLTAIGMAKQAMLRIMAENRSRDISSRLTPELQALGITTPIELWKHLFKEGRIQGTPVTPEQVILELLPEVTFEIKGGQLTRHGVIYRSEQFSQTKVGREPWRYEGAPFKGRAFDISNRVEWIIVDKRLVKVSAVPAVQEHEDFFLMGARELEANGRAKRAAQSTAKELNGAEAVRLEIDSMEQTGQFYGAATVKSGRAKSRRSRREQTNNIPA